MSCNRRTWKSLLCNHRKYMIIILTPLLLLPVVLHVEGLMGRCGYMLLLMAVYWVTEVVPLAVTGLIPLFMAPMFGLLTGSQVASNYTKDVTVLLIGGLFVAIAIERSNLHKRIALGVLKLVGTTPKWLMLGFMIPTFLCSMFMSNTATTAMMLPIMEAVLDQLRETPNLIGPSESGDDPKSQGERVNPVLDETDSVLAETTLNDGFLRKSAFSNSSMQVIEDTCSVAVLTPVGNNVANRQISYQAPKDNHSADFTQLCKGMTLSICYIANVGGTATLTGSPPNLILKGFADEIWWKNMQEESPVSYSSWMAFAFLVTVINFVVIYLWLVVFYLGYKSLKCKAQDPSQRAAVKAVINENYRKLGSITYAEVNVAVLFILLVCLWFFRSPGFIKGWSKYFKDGYVSDGAPATFIAIMLFCLPTNPPIPWEEQPREHAPSLLQWEDVHEKFPWSLIFLIGGGFSLAQAAQVSGLSAWVGEQLSVFGTLPDFFMIAIICLLVAMVTEITSNSATCTMLMPVMAAMAESLGRNPLYLMLPTAISTSYAFMMPVATPPNAIAFSYGRLRVTDMMKAGAILNVLCVFSVTLATTTWGIPLFNLNTIPWANSTSQATAQTTTMETTTLF